MEFKLKRIDYIKCLYTYVSIINGEHGATVPRYSYWKKLGYDKLIV